MLHQTVSYKDCTI